jgi:hypothetical protein
MFISASDFMFHATPEVKETLKGVQLGEKQAIS